MRRLFAPKVIAKVPPYLFYCLTAFSIFSETIFSSTLPNLAEDLNTEASIAQLASGTYYLGFATGILTLGRISDVFGRRPLVLIGMLLYALMTYSMTYCQDIYILISMRFFQAYGASVGSVIGQAMLRDSYRGWELSYIYASAGIIFAFTPVIGTFIGSYLVDIDGWRLVFYFLSIISTCLLCLHGLFLPETNSFTQSARNNKYLSVLQAAMRDKVLLSYAFIVGTFNGLCYGFYIQAPFIFREHLQMPAWQYSCFFFLLTVANLGGALFARRMIRNFVSTKKIKIMGLIASSVGALLLLSGAIFAGKLSPTAYGFVVFVPMTIHFIGHTLLIPLLLRHALEDYYKVTGTAGSIFGTSYYIMTSVINYMISLFYSEHILNYAVMFTCMIAMCVYLYCRTLQWKKEAKKYEFV